jgi:hypothetical protein
MSTPLDNPYNYKSTRPIEADSSSRLDSWKQIASYLSRDVRTVQRWEKSEGLPVHKHFHRRSRTVWAFKMEIDAWLRTRDASQVDTPRPDICGTSFSHRSFITLSACVWHLRCHTLPATSQYSLVSTFSQEAPGSRTAKTRGLSLITRS